MGTSTSLTIRYTDEKGAEQNITRHADKKMRIDFSYMQMCGNIVICECKNAENILSLDLSNNKITKIGGLGLNHLTNLQILYLYNNRITEIKGLGLNHLTNLQILWLGDNQITEIKGLDHLTNLRELWLSSNAITEVPNSIMNLRNLRNIYINCEINHIVQRFLDRNNIKNNNTTYTDGQNVHDSQIVKSVQKSIYAIIQDVVQGDIDITLNDILKDDIVSKSTKAQFVEYCEDKTVHSLLNLTFGEILVAVWKVIVAHKDSREIKEILNGEMSDSMCKCFTGRISRLVNSLNGFDDRIAIKISDGQEILNVIINIRHKYTDIVHQKTEIIKELTGRGYDMPTINEYIVYLE
jgi:hypothetical protein